VAWGRWGATMNETMGTADMNALRSKAPPLPKCGGGHRQDNGSRTEGAARGGGGGGASRGSAGLPGGGVARQEDK